MSRYICLDTSVLIKTLVEEDDTDKALALMEKVSLSAQIIVLPSFAWTELGSVLGKMQRKNLLTAKEAGPLRLKLLFSISILLTYY